MAIPGLMFVVSKPIDPKITPHDLYNRFYNDEHLPDVLKHGTAKIALRYQNADPNSATQYIALYPLTDVAYLASDDLQTFIQETRKSRILEVDDIYTRIEFGLCPYKKIQTFEGVASSLSSSSSSPPNRGKTIVAVAMQPAAGTEQDFDAWYRKQHLDMLSMCKGYLRCTRYERVDGQKPHFLALHEYDCSAAELPAEQLKVVVGTEWSKKVVSGSEVFDRNVFELVSARGDMEVKL